MSGLLGHAALGDLTLGDLEDELGAAHAVRTQPTFAAFPSAGTRSTFPVAQTRAVFPAAATSVTVPVATTRGSFYTREVSLVG
jgi:hypothetical protein